MNMEILTNFVLGIGLIVSSVIVFFVLRFCAHTLLRLFTSSQLKTLIFDIDRTLHLSTAFKDYWIGEDLILINKLRRRHGKAALTAAEYGNSVDDIGPDEAFRDAWSDASGQWLSDKALCRLRRRGRRAQGIEQNRNLITTFSCLREQGYTIVAYSDNPISLKMLKALGIAKYVHRVVVAPARFGKLKHKLRFIHVLRSTWSFPTQTAMFGDSQVSDIAPAQKYLPNNRCCRVVGPGQLIEALLRVLPHEESKELKQKLTVRQ